MKPEEIKPGSRRNRGPVSMLLRWAVGLLFRCAATARVGGGRPEHGRVPEAPATPTSTAGGLRIRILRIPEVPELQVVKELVRRREGAALKNVEGKLSEDLYLHLPYDGDWKKYVPSSLIQLLETYDTEYVHLNRMLNGIEGLFKI